MSTLQRRHWCDAPDLSVPRPLLRYHQFAEPIPRFTVAPAIGWGPDGSTLWRVIDGTLGEPEDIVTQFSTHPRMHGEDAERKARETAAALNAGTLDPEDM